MITSSNKNITYSFDDVNYGNENTKIINNTGTYKGYVKGKHGKGECSITLTDDQVDNKKPVCSIEITGTGNTRTLTLKTNDNDLAEKPYLFDGGSYDTKNSKQVTVAGTYKGYVKDTAGNVSDACSVVVSFDNEGPIIVISKTGGKNQVTITAKISDISNVAGYTISTTKTTPTSWTNVNNLPEVTSNFTKTSAGVYYVHAIDTLGNTSYKEVNLSLSSHSKCSCSKAKECCYESYKYVCDFTDDTEECEKVYYDDCGANEKKSGCAEYSKCWLS